MTDVTQRSDGRWIIMHAGKEVAEDFPSEADAWSWADRNIDDQVFDSRNHFADPLVYRSEVVSRRGDH